MRVTEKASNGNGDWLQRAAECLAIEVDSRGRSGFAEWEKTALACGNEIVRRALEAQLQRIADAEGSTVQGNGATYRRHQPGRLTYHSLAGPLRVERWTYRQCGTHADLFDYAILRERGHHVGSGVTGGACKSLIMLRAKRSGQRWTPKGIHAVLTLRSLVVNERIQPFWRKLLKDKHDLEPAAA